MGEVVVHYMEVGEVEMVVDGQQYIINQQMVVFQVHIREILRQMRVQVRILQLQVYREQVEVVMGRVMVEVAEVVQTQQ
jgi:hypothetical protein